MSVGSAPERELDPVWFRRVLGRLPTGVTVVTASTGDGPVGMVVGTFTSVSLHPPLVGMFIDRDSSSWPRIESAGTFTANVLAAEQRELCKRFSARGTDRFRGLRWQPSTLGNPVLPGVTGWIDCALDEIRGVGDHVLVVGRVVDLAEADAEDPLVFHRGALCSLNREG
ncbi:flavin reductase family protein [Saccharopolyspora taberi]|uniref:Flavin reductase family protein n=1 Tax=Saccharopolyspora taberi TaxID=60895 RepID=A0ABN3VBN1_9PSEU